MNNNAITITFEDLLKQLSFFYKEEMRMRADSLYDIDDVDEIISEMRGVLRMIQRLTGNRIIIMHDGRLIINGKETEYNLETI